MDMNKSFSVSKEIEFITSSLSLYNSWDNSDNNKITETKFKIIISELSNTSLKSSLANIHINKSFMKSDTLIQFWV